MINDIYRLIFYPIEKFMRNKCPLTDSIKWYLCTVWRIKWLIKMFWHRL